MLRYKLVLLNLTNTTLNISGALCSTCDTIHFLEASPNMADLISSLPAEYKSKYPALQPPPGVQSNFVDPDSRGYVLLTVGSILFALMVFVLAARIYVRFFVARQFSWGDGEYPSHVPTASNKVSF